jgi:hypothetical protein
VAEVRISHAHVVKSQPTQQRPILLCQRQGESIFNKLFLRLAVSQLSECLFDCAIRRNNISSKTFWSLGTVTVINCTLLPQAFEENLCQIIEFVEKLLN